MENDVIFGKTASLEKLIDDFIEEIMKFMWYRDFIEEGRLRAAINVLLTEVAVEVQRGLESPPNKKEK